MTTTLTAADLTPAHLGRLVTVNTAQAQLTARLEGLIALPAGKADTAAARPVEPGAVDVYVRLAGLAPVDGWHRDGPLASAFRVLTDGPVIVWAEGTQADEVEGVTAPDHRPPEETDIEQAIHELTRPPADPDVIAANRAALEDELASPLQPWQPDPDQATVCSCPRCRADAAGEGDPDRTTDLSGEPT